MDRKKITISEQLKQNKNDETIQISTDEKVNTHVNTYFPLMRCKIWIKNVDISALLDTGAAASLIALSTIEKLPKNQIEHRKETADKSVHFRSISGEKIKSLGYCNIKFKIDSEPPLYFKHPFYVVKNLDENCILGIDYMMKNNLSIFPHEGAIAIKRNDEHTAIFVNNSIPVRGIEFEERKTSLNVPDEFKSRIEELLQQYPNCYAEKMSQLGAANIINHRIETKGPPIFEKLRRTPQALRIHVKAQIDEMLENGIIRESSSPYAAAIVMVKKKDGKYRMCVDYRRLNAVTIKDKYPLPNITDTIDELNGAAYFTSLDLFSGYWQLGLHEEDKHKTAFICELGQFEFNRLPFGLVNSPSIFQRTMNKLFKSVLHQFVLCYVDDAIIYSRTIKEHLEHLRIVLQILQDAKLRLNLAKCSFCQTQLHYLGHVVSGQGVSPGEEKVKAIRDYPTPTGVKEAQSFLGCANFFRKFIRNYADMASPLYRLLKKNTPWRWTGVEENAFNRIKTALTSFPVLRMPDWSRQFILSTDSSGYGVGAILCQMQKPIPQGGFKRPSTGEQKAEEICPRKGNQEISKNSKDDEELVEVVIAYSSKHLNEQQKKYSVTELECYAILHAITVFRPYLYAREFLVKSDHRPLEWLMAKAQPAGRLARWALRMQEFQFKIVYQPGKTNQRADCLSRIPIRAVS